VIVDQQILPPPAGWHVDRTCGARPTAVVIRACFGRLRPGARQRKSDGAHVARPDRSSFGCARRTIPHFDECFLSSISTPRPSRLSASRCRPCRDA
jgi:hypothetical protein